MNTHGIDMVAIGGSAGSIPLIMNILKELPKTFSFTVVIIIHRLKNVPSEMNQLLSLSGQGIEVREPDDKEPVEKQHIYLAPQNYHLLIEKSKTFSLDYSEPILYSRPSIDPTFESVAEVYANRAVGLLLSGANADGSQGLSAIVEQGGTGIVQEPSTAEYPIMPQTALAKNTNIIALTPIQISRFLHSLNT